MPINIRGAYVKLKPQLVDARRRQQAFFNAHGKRRGRKGGMWPRGTFLPAREAIFCVNLHSVYRPLQVAISH
jgi:hypothetical protein